MSQILVVGSSNTDMVVKTRKLPAPGETVLGGTFLMNPGGKGANQAVGAARLGGQVTFVAKVGNDIFGQQAVSGFQQEGINTVYILTDGEHPSGVALINVDDAGENCITVAPGSNAHLQPSDTDTAFQETPTDSLVLLQLEIPLPTVEHVVQQAAVRNLRVILNPAPAQKLPVDLFPNLFLITPNETEAELLTGIHVTDLATAEQAAQKLHEMGVPNVVITLGSKGAYLHSGTSGQLITSPVVKAVDSTAAGDCFNGALTVALAEGKSLPDAVAFGCKAASISVTRMGAQASMPKRSELA
ncbi:ribokinase [Spirosoma endophyticum]|uniref:Ribokinase n=1 Tax=Spirosoma endophyticum TaxID=662367 RepID=A0A1I1XV58_9BACT|nr:ribokinase [Spirosoma endophyticum]SFE11184.1 ribokinase [Spirosoma endophyticum]